MYRAYVRTHDGKTIPGYVELEESVEAIMRYFRIQAVINPDVIVTNHQDEIVAEMKDGKLVFPEVDHEMDFRKIKR